MRCFLRDHAFAWENILAVTDSRSGWVTPTLRVADVDAGCADIRRAVADDAMLSDPLADEPKWPAWKVTVALVVFCSAFWSGVWYLASLFFR
jgi:hypothetical protein